MSHQAISGLDLDDLTPKQLRKMLNGLVRNQLPYGKKTDEEKEKHAEKDEEESSSLADLKESKNGKPKTPKVEEDDLVAEKDLPFRRKKKKEDA
jgi:hypothetical protein